MRDLRNPFRLQTAESIDSDADFLRLFGPGVLDLLAEGAPWSRPQFIRSAPGGGKTSLLKLFTPSVLQTLLALRGNADYRELFQRLRQLDVVTEHEVRVVGVLLTCRQTFPDLADLGLTDPSARRLLLALLDARLLLGALRSALTARRLRYPDDLHRVSVKPSADVAQLPGLTLPCDGVAARSWAESTEQAICDVIDSMSSADGARPPGHDSLQTLRLLDAQALQVDDASVGERWLILLDDVQKLTLQQRVDLRETLLEQRSRSTIWFAERLSALSTDELLAPGALPGRDYGNVINLEEAWRKKGKFESAASVIAERRARMATDVATTANKIPGFAASLESTLDKPEWAARTEAALDVVRIRIHELAEKAPQYRDWVAARDGQEGSPVEQLIAWRTLEILIERHKRKRQPEFSFLTEEDLEEKDDSGVRAAAELFVAKEFFLPYYFGPSRLASLGSCNIEQYLSLAGDFFEDLLAGALLRQLEPLSAERQQKMIRGAYDARFRDLPRRSKRGRDALKFIDAVGSFCKAQTYQPNAPYAPGVTGIAISMAERQELIDAAADQNGDPRGVFAEVLATALAHNLFHAELDRPRPRKGGRYMVLYLNRLVCPKFDLPPHFGGYRERPVKELIGWLRDGYRPPSRPEALAL